MSRIYNPRDILLRPVVSEKSYGLLDEGKYTFVVAPDALHTVIKSLRFLAVALHWKQPQVPSVCTRQKSALGSHF